MSTASIPAVCDDVPEIEKSAEQAAAPLPPKPDWSKQHEIAKYLDWLTHGKLDVWFDPTNHWDRDAFHPDCPSKGHIYSVRVNENTEERWLDLWLDDQREKPLEAQLVEAVRQIAKRFSKLADKIEARLAYVQPSEDEFRQTG